MGILKILFIILFLVSLPISEAGRVNFGEVAISLLDINVFLITIVWVTHKIYKKEKIKNILVKPIILLFCIFLLSLISNFNHLNLPQILISVSYSLRWIIYASIYLVVNNSNLNFKKNLSNLMLVSGGLIVLIGFLQYFFYPDLRNLYYLGWDEHLYRMFSSFLDPNFLGTFFVLFFIFVVCFILKRNQLDSKSKFLHVVSILTLIAILLTFSRATYIMLGVSLVLIFIIKKQTKSVLIYFLVFVFSFFIISKNVLNSEGTNLLRTASGNARIDSINKGIFIFKENPILGIGFNSYRYAQKRFGFINEDIRLIHSAAGTDNSFIFLLATSGIVGLLGFLFLIYKILIFSYIKIEKNYYAEILLISLISLLVNSIFINSLFFPPIMLWMWTIAGLTENT